ncbi:MAG TPA: hypothetical protein VGS22_03910 [Thermoanaerobaculia bacterium]|nr:hypothetical protein [Thermoanaerobaculia bacterium]
MPRAIPEGRLFLLDACCLINLLTTERAGEILEALPYRWAVPRFVAENEVLRLGVKRGSHGEVQRPITVAEIRAETGVEILDIESPIEIKERLRFGELLDQGEANACALAVGRQGGVATDDKKALALLARTAPEVPTLQSPEILFESLEGNRWTDLEVRRMLRAIRDRAKFVPHRGAPHFDWWTKLLGGNSK